MCLSLWGFAEIIIGAVGGKLAVSQLAGPILIVGLGVALARAFYRYWSYVPIALQQESPSTQEIYKQQKCGWQFAMARQMLAERLVRTESSLDRIQRGAEFVEPILLELDDYIRWVKERPNTFLRLSHSISVICTNDIPKALALPGGEDSLISIVAEIDYLATVYEELKNQELSCYEMVPPEPLEDLHSLTYGWTNTIRAGVHQFLGILDELGEIDREALIAGIIQPPTLNFEFDSPPAVERFSRALSNFDYSSLAASEAKVE